MTPEQSKQLKIGQQVVRNKNYDLHGTVIRITNTGYQIRWDDEVITSYSPKEMLKIRIVK